MTDRDVSRRGALKYFGLLAGTARGAKFLGVWEDTAGGRKFLASWLPVPVVPAAGTDDLVTIHGMTHSHADREDEKPETPYVPQFFKGDQFKTVETLTEMILPTDDQPGAKEAQVANYIDFIVASAKEF